MSPTSPESVADKVDRWVDRARDQWDNVGVAIAVVAHNEVIHARGYGVLEVGMPERINEHTLFQIGSTTKAFTAAAVGLLVDEGALNWDDLVVEYLPWFQLRDPWVTRQLTIRDILTHRTGLGTSLYPFYRIADQDETIAQLRRVTCDGRFRDCFVYDNSLYAVAGKVIEVATGHTWQEFIETRLLEPLQMTRSGTSPYDFWDAAYVTPTFLGRVAEIPSYPEARVTNVAMPHGWGEDGSPAVIPWQSYDNAAASGAVVSSTADMANWLLLNVGEGRFHGMQLLSKKTLDELHTTQNHHDGGVAFPLADTTEGYTLGWWRATYQGETHLSHSGGMLGFPAYIAILPERGFGVVVLANGISRARGGDWPRGDYPAAALFNKAIALATFDALLGEESRDWPATLVEAAREQQTGSRSSEDELLAARDPIASLLPLAEYSGVYEDAAGGSGPVEVTLKPEGLQLAFDGAGAYSAMLEPWLPGVFRLRSGPVVADLMRASGPSHEFVSFLHGLGAGPRMLLLGATFERVGSTHTRS